MKWLRTCLFLLLASISFAADFSEIPTEPTPGDEMLKNYFELETRRITNRTTAFIESEGNWPDQQANLRRQLFEMLGLQPLPARSDLKAKITGSTERDGIIVENIVFQSRPGLYVTANFYRPVEQDGPLPTILYVCGHGKVKIDDVSYGNKTHYQHHGAWFAQNGYTCLTIDTLQLGEIEGTHHGTHREGRWWWNSRGYTPAGVEAWNSIRALDYLETRPEVDKEKFGVTGRSGGGAYTFWVSALDERVKVSAPVAGITSMHNHIVDGCIEGHCDCMFMVNTYRWDFPLLGSLIAPRPFLILNTDKDRIFPLDGVVDVYQKSREVYAAMGAEDKIGLAIYEGPHKDTQPLRVSAFHWFARHLKGEDIDYQIPDTTTEKLFEPEELKVLEEIPENERNTFIDEYFTRRVERSMKRPASKSDWAAESSLIVDRLKSRSFRGWPTKNENLGLTEVATTETDGIALTSYTFDSQAQVKLPLFVARPAGIDPEDLDLLVLNVMDDDDWSDFLSSVGAAFPENFPDLKLPNLDTDAFESGKQMHASQKWGMAYLPPRGIGPTAWTSDEKERIHIRRRFNLLGQTIDGQRIWDIRRGISALREIDGLSDTQLWLQASGIMAGNALYAGLFEENIHRLDLHDPPASHDEGPELLNVLRFTDIPQIAGIVGQDTQLRIYSDKPQEWKYLTDLAAGLEWPEKQLEIREPVESDPSQ